MGHYSFVDNQYLFSLLKNSRKREIHFINNNFEEFQNSVILPLYTKIYLKIKCPEVIQPWMSLHAL